MLFIALHYDESFCSVDEEWGQKVQFYLHVDDCGPDRKSSNTLVLLLCRGDKQLYGRPVVPLWFYTNVVLVRERGLRFTSAATVIKLSRCCTKCEDNFER
jgi:hypothetical protein